MSPRCLGDVTTFKLLSSSHYRQCRSHVRVMSQHWIAAIVLLLGLLMMSRHWHIFAFPSLADVVAMLQHCNNVKTFSP